MGVSIDDNGLARTFKDLFAGAVGGVAQVLIGQPFDIVKVRLQTTSNYANAAEAAKAIYAKEGLLSFYKGTLTPLIGIGACVSVQFGAFHEVRRQFESINLKCGHTGDISYMQYYLAGATAGIANTVLSTPIEHVRIRLQTQPHGNNRLYNGPADCIRKLVSQCGIGNGLYRGTVVTLLREAQAYGLWFLTFEFLMTQTMKHTKREDIPSWKIALYGGLAGEALWLGSYPMDVIKSKMQTDALSNKDRLYKSSLDCTRKTWHRDGMMGFWRGLTPTLMRALPVSAGTFFVWVPTDRCLFDIFF